MHDQSARGTAPHTDTPPEKPLSTAQISNAEDMSRSALDAALISAHEIEDKAQLVELYERAADILNAQLKNDQCEADRRKNSLPEGIRLGQAFYLTHAWVYAVEIGAEAEHRLYQRLKAMDAVD